MTPLFAGFDVSTQSTKLVVIDPDAGAVVFIDRIVYDSDLPQYGTDEGAVTGLGHGASESDPNMWIEAVERILERLAASDIDGERIRCISVSGQQHGLVALTADGQLARPRSKLWNDFSTEEECQILTEAVGGPAAMIEEVGNTQRTGYTAPKILHLLLHEPEVYARASTLFVVHNYVNWYLTGGADGGVAAMEPGDTSGMALWHPGKQRWSKRVIDAIDPGLSEKLPPVEPADRTIGNIGADLAARFSLSPECRIDAGSGDNMYGAVGTGNFEPGIVTVSLGTSGTACTVLEEPFIDPTGEIAAYCDSTGKYLPLLCVSNMSNGYNAILERFELTHDAFDEIVRNMPPGNEGRLLVPWYEGERTPDLPLAAPLYFGFSLSDFVPEKLCRAVVEGHVLNLYEGFTQMPVTPKEIRLTGGLSSSPSWCQTIADVFDAETVPVEGEGAALGAAIHAAWSRRARPDPAQRSTYAVFKRLYRAITQRLRGLEGEDPFALGRALRTT
jgi:xylulokinase